MTEGVRVIYGERPGAFVFEKLRGVPSYAS